MNKKNVLLICMLQLFSFHFLSCKAQHTDTLNNFKDVWVMFYNVENLFDDIDDPHNGDDEFQKKGLRAWSTNKYNSKIKKISQALLASNDWQPPALIGLSEIENRKVLNDLVEKSLLKDTDYKILHKESGDHRGIDVGLLFDPAKCTLIDSGFYEVRLDEKKCSREILYAMLSIDSDTLHVFVCHWPSRYSGALSSNAYRMLASNLLIEQYKSLCEIYDNPKVLIMGDFNDEPKDESLTNLIKKSLVKKNKTLVNLMDDDFEMGTLKYQNQWFIFDQFICSTSLLETSSGLSISDKPKICNLPFLIVNDKKYLETKPFRTFVGYKYEGGYSDHLPILIKLKRFQNNLEIPQ